MIRELDYQILDFIQEFLRSDHMDKIMVFFTKLGDYGIIWIIICAILLISPKTRYIGFIGLVSLLFSLIINDYILKNIFDRTRPYVGIDIDLLIPKLESSSFPSGHTSSSFAAALVFNKYFRKPYSYLALLLAAIIAFSRLYLYVHFPTDVLFGIVSGFLCSLLAIILFDQYKRYQERKLLKK
ncbi:MAG TPA: phosphatase PAP2 family protein [Haloplasmataceae bacterium]